MKVFTFLLLCSLFLFFNNSKLFSQVNTGTFGIRGGVGTDINLGIAYGLGLNYTFPTSNFELTFLFFKSHSEETSTDYFTYTDKTDLVVFGVLGNYLIGYQNKVPGLYGIVGFGFSAVSVDWEETSRGDISLGTPLAGGGSKMSASGTNGGSVINAGVGYSFGQLNLRGEFPVIIIFSQTGDAATVAPTFIVTLGYYF